MVGCEGVWAGNEGVKSSFCLLLPPCTLCNSLNLYNESEVQRGIWEVASGAIITSPRRWYVMNQVVQEMRV